MSTRAAVIFKDSDSELYFYRHSDGYPEVTGEDLKNFVEGYKTHLRNNIGQSAGHLIVRGHNEYKKEGLLDYEHYDWKVGAYEPSPYGPDQYGDLEYIYTIDLTEMKLTYKKVYGKKEEVLLSSFKKES
jgi:hypothetical protein